LFFVCFFLYFYKRKKKRFKNKKGIKKQIFQKQKKEKQKKEKQKKEKKKKKEKNKTKEKEKKQKKEKNKTKEKKMNFRPPFPPMSNGVQLQLPFGTSNLNPNQNPTVFLNGRPPPPPTPPPPAAIFQPLKKSGNFGTGNFGTGTGTLRNEMHFVPENEQDMHLSEEGGVGFMVFNPFNSLNIKIAKEEVQEILSKYGIDLPIRNLELYQRAFIHRSYTKRPDADNDAHRIRIAEPPPDCLPLSSKSNERLEFLGDGILELVVKFYLYRRFPKEPEGFMTEKKIAIVKNEAIGKIAQEMGLQKWLVLSKHAEEKKIRGNLKKLGCLFEAFLGAVFLDFNFNHGAKEEKEDKKKNSDNICLTTDIIITRNHGFEIARKFLENVLEQHVDWTAIICNDDNYKNILQVKIQREFKVTPLYLEIGPSSLETGFCMGVYLCLGQEMFHLTHTDAISVGVFTTLKDIHTYLQCHHGKILLFLGNGQHKIKRKAEQFACCAALKELQKLPDFK
jgi:dsRNA-specific ribonuclease